jgi:hypothetical protein
MAVRHRTYTAAERAEIFQVTYAEHRQLDLRRSGCIDLDKAGRDRANRDRFNIKRRAHRAAIRAARVAAKEAAKATVEAVKAVMREESKASSGRGGVHRCNQVTKVDTSSYYYSNRGNLCSKTHRNSVNTLHSSNKSPDFRDRPPKNPKIARAQGP